MRDVARAAKCSHESLPPWMPPALAEAYRDVGEAIIRIVFPALGMTLASVDDSDPAQATLTVETQVGDDRITHEMRWPVLVQTFNDLKAMRQPLMAFRLRTATAATLRGGEVK